MSGAELIRKVNGWPVKAVLGAIILWVAYQGGAVLVSQVTKYLTKIDETHDLAAKSARDVEAIKANLATASDVATMKRELDEIKAWRISIEADRQARGPWLLRLESDVKELKAESRETRLEQARRTSRIEALERRLR